jgi:PhzF family phenazine biosynthesis protein
MPLPLFLVDAFTDGPFRGNPAGVCLLPNWLERDFLAAVAREMNQAETAFLVQNDAGFDLRWFTPAVEVDLCGHATLASAHVLWTEGLATGEAIAFSTRSGILTARRAGEEIEMDFPITRAEPAGPPDGLLDGLGVAREQVRYVGRNKFDYLIELADEAAVRALAPDFRKLKTVAARGVIVTSRAATPPYDIVSRFFAPASGVDEDPVTGSAHCCLIDHWRSRLGKDKIVAYQASSRGGSLRVRAAGERALLYGKAVMVMKGELVVGD